jgi:hypothetical protein
MSVKQTAGKRRVGDGTPGPGRPKGSHNRATETIRTAIATFVEGNAGQVQNLWQRVAEKDPDKALDLYVKLAEFVLPKLARTEINGEIGVRGTLVIRD